MRELDFAVIQALPREERKGKTTVAHVYSRDIHSGAGNCACGMPARYRTHQPIWWRLTHRRKWWTA
jgi:hypothetical protein